MTQELYSTLKAQADKLNANPVKCNVKHGKGSGFWQAFSLPDNVENRRTFNVRKDGESTATLFGRWQVCPTGLIFAVFSYGTHFPITIYSETSGIWYFTTSGRSVTTSCHIGRVRVGLRDVQTVPLDCEGMKLILRMGENAELMTESEIENANS